VCVVVVLSIIALTIIIIVKSIGEYKIRMAEAGYEQVMVIGKSNLVWKKVK
jgi:hypothetical protein